MTEKKDWISPLSRTELSVEHRNFRGVNIVIIDASSGIYVWIHKNLNLKKFTLFDNALNDCLLSRNLNLNRLQNSL